MKRAELSRIFLDHLGLTPHHQYNSPPSLADVDRTIVLIEN
jgi:hypothetical protein